MKDSLFNNYNKLTRNIFWFQTCLYKENIIDVLESSIQFKDYQILIEPIVWEYDDANKFELFEEYKQYSLKRHPQYINSLEMIEAYIDRIQEIIYEIEERLNFKFDIFLKKNGYLTYSKFIEIIEESKNRSKKYLSFNEFKRRENSIGYTIVNFGEFFIQELCENLIDDRSSTKYTAKMLIEEAKKYEYKVDFIRNGKGAYRAAKKIGLEFLETICSHMKVEISQREQIYTEEEFITIPFSFMGLVPKSTLLAK